MSFEERVAAHTANRDVAALVAEAESAELKCARDGSTPKYGVLLLAYLLADKVDHARLMWLRVPEDVQSKQVELNKFWQVAQSMLADKKAEVYAKLRAQQWSKLHTPLVEWLVEAYRERNAALLARAYASVRAAQAASALGFAVDAVGNYLVERGWTVDGELFVAPPEQSDAPLDDATARVSAQLAARLAEQVLFVEK
eukprot:TRINITY_DN9114_c0_g1_i1.p2 TRINITY_DN9114_c0_g1~~TRINITY_DN9114_c0_g1_i1.p2  ORF type:complete len:198 (-),score=108.54 TRINITY_DN9114_c0_g1_i1:51-644(-)